jgi:hypothetical protein
VASRQKKELKETMPHGRPGCKWNNETDVGEQERVRLLQDDYKYRDVVHVMTKLLVPQNAGNFLNYSGTVRFRRGTAQ